MYGYLLSSLKKKKKGIRMTSYISNAPNVKKINGDGMSTKYTFEDNDILVKVFLNIPGAVLQISRVLLSYGSLCCAICHMI